MRAFKDDHRELQELASESLTSCIGGMANIYPCSNVDLLAFLPLNQIGGGSGNDIWGWTDTLTGKEWRKKRSKKEHWPCPRLKGIRSEAEMGILICQAPRKSMQVQESQPQFIPLGDSTALVPGS
jgi:hypothetical protein